MIQLQVRIEQERSQLVTPSVMATGKLNVHVEVLVLNATKPESDIARRLAGKINFWLNTGAEPPKGALAATFAALNLPDRL